MPPATTSASPPASTQFNNQPAMQPDAAKKHWPKNPVAGIRLSPPWTFSERVQYPPFSFAQTEWESAKQNMKTGFKSSSLCLQVRLTIHSAVTLHRRE
ncbi:hypothetical protein Y032_0042g526 [Ancylostoma ceylanicum]|uniref:Uncharacterized protein n=1 Tax=Ancylostoma ceylanicum TaxID=53326 RepID=A0A016UGN2_9BILA|nr:hypothetical protein Y032_0042g526 [Ancylostoma ceylanicum]